MTRKFLLSILLGGMFASASCAIEPGTGELSQNSDIAMPGPILEPEPPQGPGPIAEPPPAPAPAPQPAPGPIIAVPAPAVDPLSPKGDDCAAHSEAVCVGKKVGAFCDANQQKMCGSDYEVTPGVWDCLCGPKW